MTGRRVARRAKTRATAGESVEGRWPLPPGWIWKRAGDFATIVGGSTPKNAADPANFDPAGTPWITPADLSGYTQATINAGRRNLANTVVNRASLLPAGSVLISSRAPVGYCAVAANPVTTNQGFRSLVIDGTVDPFFLRYYVLYSRDYLEANASGTTFKELSGTALADLVFPLPPMDVQRHVVARIDELFIELEDGEATLARARSDLGIWRKALLKAAVTGELTADWRAANPPSETGADLLARILTDRRTRWHADPKHRGKQYVEPAGPDQSLLPEVPRSWTWTNIDQLSTRVTKGSSPGWQGFDYQPDGILFVRSQNVGWGELRLDDQVYVDAAFNDIESKAVLNEGDILLNIVGASIGRACRSDHRLVGANTNQAVAGIRPVTAATSDYLVAWLISPAGQSAVFRNVVETARPNLSLEQARAIPVPLPPLSEIAQVMRAYHSAVEAQRAADKSIEEVSAESATLRQSILSAAFRGELVQ